jgi:hypothetical protein
MRIRIGTGNQSTQRTPAPVPLCPPVWPKLGLNPGCQVGRFLKIEIISHAFEHSLQLWHSKRVIMTFIWF